MGTTKVQYASRLSEAELIKSGTGEDYQKMQASILASSSIFDVMKAQNAKSSSSTSDNSSGGFSLSKAKSQVTDGDSATDSTNSKTKQSENSTKDCAKKQSAFKTDSTKAKTLETSAQKNIASNEKKQSEMIANIQSLSLDTEKASSEIEATASSGQAGDTSTLSSQIESNKNQLSTLSGNLNSSIKTTSNIQTTSTNQLKAISTKTAKANADSASDQEAAKAALEVSKTTSTVGSAINNTSLLADGFCAAAAATGIGASAAAPVEAFNTAYIKPTGQITSAAGALGSTAANVALGNNAAALASGISFATSVAGSVSSVKAAAATEKASKATDALKVANDAAKNTVATDVANKAVDASTKSGTSALNGVLDKATGTAAKTATSAVAENGGNQSLSMLTSKTINKVSTNANSNTTNIFASGLKQSSIASNTTKKAATKFSLGSFAGGATKSLSGAQGLSKDISSLSNDDDSNSSKKTASNTKTYNLEKKKVNAWGSFNSFGSYS